VAKIKAAVDSGRDSNLQIVAGPDARAILGLQAAIERAGAMIEAGADMTLVEATGADILAVREAKRTFSRKKVWQAGYMTTHPRVFSAYLSERRCWKPSAHNTPPTLP
jgi:2-methylisocitrate lyase-like PEP mutase family enzyme